jgi:hypothetical protein
MGEEMRAGIKNSPTATKPYASRASESKLGRIILREKPMEKHVTGFLLKNPAGDLALAVDGAESHHVARQL